MNIEERIESLQANIDALSAKFDKVLELLEGSNKVDTNVKLALLIEKEDQNLKLNNQILAELKKLNEKIEQFEEEEEEEFTPEQGTQFMNQMFANVVANQYQHEPTPKVEEERITPNKETFETVDDVMNAQHDERKLEALRNMKFDTTAFNNILGGGSASSVNLGEPSTPSMTPSNPPPPPRQNVNYGPAEDPFGIEATFQNMNMNIPPVQSIPVQPVQPQRNYALKYNKGMDAFCAIRIQDNAINEYPRGSIGYEYIKQVLKQNANGRQTAQLNMISDNNIMQIVNNIKQLEAQNAAQQMSYQQTTYQQPQQQVYQQGPTRRTMVSQQYNPMMYGMQQPVSITPPDEFIPAPPIGMGYEDYGNTNNSYTYNNYAPQQQNYGYNDPYALQPALSGNELNSNVFDKYFGSAMRRM